MAAASGGKLYVVGGYGDARDLAPATRTSTDGKRWRNLAPMPTARAAGGAAIVGGKLYVIGGVAPKELARQAFALDLASGKWSTIAGPTPREHLAVTAAGGRVYALAGRLGGDDANLMTFEAYTPATGTWESLPPVPEPRGGTGAAVAGGLIVSVGGEEPEGTIHSVYGYDLATGQWRRLPGPADCEARPRGRRDQGNGLRDRRRHEPRPLRERHQRGAGAALDAGGRPRFRCRVERTALGHGWCLGRGLLLRLLRVLLARATRSGASSGLRMSSAQSLSFARRPRTSSSS